MCPNNKPESTNSPGDCKLDRLWAGRINGKFVTAADVPRKQPEEVEMDMHTLIGFYRINVTRFGRLTVGIFADGSLVKEDKHKFASHGEKIYPFEVDKKVVQETREKSNQRFTLTAKWAKDHHNINKDKNIPWEKTISLSVHCPYEK